MEAANCLPKSCENKIRHKNGPNNINNETLQNHCNDVDGGGGGGGCGGCCDGDGGGLRNDEDIEALSSQLKDVCAGAAGGPKLFPPTPNGFWIGPNYCENGIDKGKCINNVENEQSSVTVQVVTDSSTTQLDGNFLTMGHPTDDDESSSTSTATTTITTASPGSHADFEIECCASDRNGDDDDEVEKQTTNAETEEEEEDCEIVDRCGPFECTYVSCEPRRAVTVNDAGAAAAATVEARKPCVASAGSSSHLVTVPMPPPHQPSCSPLKSSAAAPQLPPPPPGLLQIKFSNRQANNNENASEDDDDEIRYEVYTSELQMGVIMRLIQKDLSEPYSIYTYRYFIHNWPKLCFLAMHGTQCVGSIVCKLDLHKKVIRRGYIAMLAVDERYRKRKIGSNLVLQAIQAMIADDADEVVLETEISNKPALRLYENLGFVRDKRLFRYYLNGVDALRLKLWLH